MNLKPFLYLDNWHEAQPETRFDRALAAIGLNIDRYQTNIGEFPEHFEFCGVYVSPSFDGAYDDLPWVHKLHELLCSLAQQKIPMIGLCFGCQVLASALVSRDMVFKRAAHEGGRDAITLTAAARNDSLCQNLPNDFEVFHWHGDEVRSDHQQIIVLAEGPGCRNQIWRWSEGPVWGIQPHPEMNGGELHCWIEQNRSRFEAMGHDVDSYLSQCFSSDSGYAILERFLAHVTRPELAMVSCAA